MMTESDIVEKVLLHLQGYVVESEDNTEEFTDLEYDKKVTKSEIENFYNFAQTYALSYIQQKAFPTIIEDETEVINPICQNAVYMWTAGLIWKKYDVRTNNQTDETVTLGFGDALIIQAKEMLKPFKYYKMMVY